MPLLWSGKPSESSAVNWDEVERTLQSIRPEYKQRKFDSLKHVVEILSSIDPQRELEQLSTRLAEVETRVDTVVEAYHNGFNKSIQNYSRILQLFADAKSQVQLTKRSLEDCQRHGGSQARGMQALWKRNVMNREAVRLFESIQRVVHAPEMIDNAVARGDWVATVDLLQDACGMLAADEMKNVGGVSKLKMEMISRIQVTEDNLVDALLAIPFETAASAVSAPACAAANLEAQFERLPRDGDSPADSQRQLARAPSMIGGLRRPGGKGAVKRNTSFRRNASVEQLRASLASRQLSAETPTGEESPVARMVELVGCIASLGPGTVQVAKNALWHRMQSEIHELLLRVLDAVPHPEDLLRALSGLGVGSDEPEFGMDSSMRTAHRVTALVLKAAESVVCMLVLLARLLGDCRPKEHCGADRLQHAQGDASVMAGRYKPAIRIAGLQGDEFKNATNKRAWTLVQEECLQYLSQLLQIQFVQKTSGKNSERTEAMAAHGWLKDAWGKDNAFAKDTRLTFSLQVDLEDDYSQRAKAASGTRGRLSYPGVMLAALGEQPASQYLTPAVYRLVLDFATSAGEMLERLTVNNDAKKGAASRNMVVPALRSNKNNDQKITFLDTKLEDFVAGSFLPKLYVDFRGRITAALEDPEAFKPTTQPRAHSSMNHATARPKLPAAYSLEIMVDELLSLGSGLGSFSPQVAGLAENLVGKVMESFGQRVGAITNSCTAGRLATTRPDLANAMANEPAAVALGSPLAFYVPGSVESFEPSNFVSQFTAGLGTGGIGVEEEVIMALRWAVKTESVERILALEPNCSSPSELAAMADSLEFIADSLAALAEHDMAIMSSALSVPTSTSPLKGTPRRGGKAVSASERHWLLHWVDRYRALSGLCMRVLRLDCLLLCAHHVASIAARSHVVADSESAATGDDASAPTLLVRHAAHLEEACLPYLSASRARYVFGAVPSTTAKLCMWALPDIRTFNAGGVAQMQRSLNLLQSALATHMTVSDDGGVAFDSVRAYYNCLYLPPAELLAAVAGSPSVYSKGEWRTLLEAHMHNRIVTEQQKKQLDDILTSPADTPVADDLRMLG